MARAKQMGRWLWLAIAVYAVLIGTVVWLMFAAREGALVDGATSESISNWRTWREDVRAQQDKSTPVERRVPKSDEPPALVLMRDYFGIAFTGAVIFSSLLYWVITWFVTGILRSTTDPSRHDAVP